MKYLFLITLILPLLQSKAQDINTLLKNERKVEVKDSMDSHLNRLIAQNPEMENKGLSLNDFFIAWSDGEIFLKNNKKVSGRLKVVRDSKYSASPTEVLFQMSDTVSATKYSAENIKGFDKEGTIFLSKVLQNKSRVLIEVLETGAINLYMRKYIRPLKDNPNGIWIITEFFLEKGKSNPYLQGAVPSTNAEFITFMANYLRDNPLLFSKVKNKNYKYEHIREIVQIYNAKK